MKLERESQDLVDRYLFAVQRALPRDTAADVTRELRTLVEDALQERAVGREPDTGDVMGVLRALGRPDEVARRFQAGPGHLLGPGVYPTFVRVMRFGLAAIAILVALLAVVQGALGGAATWRLSFWVSLAGLYGRLAVMLFVTSVVVLLVAERRRAPWLRVLQEWDPRELPELPEGISDRASPVGLVLGIVFLVILALLVSVFPGWLGVVFVAGNGGQVRLVPLSELGIALPVGLVTLACILGVALNLFVLLRGSWTRWARWAGVGLGGLVAVIAFETVRLSPLAHGVVPGDVPILRAMAPALRLGLRALPFVLLLPPFLDAVELIRKREPAELPPASEG
jgi:hypothetical protein